MSDPLLPDEFDAVLRDSLRERPEAAPISQLAEKAMMRAADARFQQRTWMQCAGGRLALLR